MHRIIWVMLLSAGVTGSVAAQDSPFQFSDDSFTDEIGQEKSSSSDAGSTSSSSTSYGSYPQMTDAKSLVRQNAAFRADQRRRRLEARRWFGYSNSRPIAASVPFMTHYSPMWASNPWNPYLWYGVYWP